MRARCNARALASSVLALFKIAAVIFPVAIAANFQIGLGVLQGTVWPFSTLVLNASKFKLKYCTFEKSTFCLLKVRGSKSLVTLLTLKSPGTDSAISVVVLAVETFVASFK